MKYALLALALLLGSVGCGAADEPASTDTGRDTTDGDTAADTPVDQNPAPDSGTDADTVSDADTDTGTSADPESGTETETDSDSETVPDVADLSGLSLSGSEPAENLEAPEFEVMAADNTERTQDNLLGQPTVMWFFPAAEAWSIG